MLYPLRADDRKFTPLIVRAGAEPAQLREYSYVAWNGEYYIRTGWGQEAGRVNTEAEARRFCAYARACMSFDGRTIHMSKTLEEWLYDVELVLPMIERGTAARKWGISNYDAGLIIAELCLARVLPVRMERRAWLAWLETYVLEM